ncbi:AAA family ATPase [[Pseudomonas] boreopolis]|uniref:ATPase AAA-type core domain-containing protein n=1 Tax=Xanthomonas boreopolis TaxID=86183 RepID=A0A919F7Q3_9XANT|nr:hypothetical protein GCM10009090_18020 [[Pseudomonas] boreopolis]
MTTKLVVKDFSCIKSADIDLASLTVLIGPSASGKSVLSKLAFFFNDLFSEQWQLVEEGKGFDAFKEHVKEKFKEWFPVEAWGGGKFVLEFSAGAFQVRISRIEYRKKLGDNTRIWFSQFFESQYVAALDFYRSFLKKSADEIIGHRAINASYEFREKLRQVNRKELGEDYHEIQTFIPAGRSFFTSVGKSIVAFEHGRVLDPLILRFGRLYAGLRESRFYSGVGKLPNDFVQKLDSLMSGSLVSERSREYLKTDDGRKVPISALSSGQQELMPLALALKSRAHVGQEYRQLIFIEEPEAHLFPAAQSALVEVFVRFLSLARGRASMFVTTHSPYVLAKINNLIKAKEVAGARRGKRHSAVASIVPEEYWLDGQRVRAYAIRDGIVERIQDSADGLIEADYLDEISGAIASEFMRLLGMEHSA